MKVWTRLGRGSLWLALVAVAGCSSSARSSSDSGAVDQICSVGSGPSKACDVQLCMAHTLDITLTDQNAPLTCTGFGGSEACQGNNDYQAFEARGPDAFLYLSFTPEIVGNYSAANFRSAFSNAWYEIYPPGRGPEFFVQQDARSIDDPFQVFEYRDGRLHLEMKLDLPTVYRRVEDDAESCVSGDIAGQCTCSYEGFDTQVAVHADLTVPR
jgi:hypothetical protein